MLCLSVSLSRYRFTGKITLREFSKAVKDRTRAAGHRSVFDLILGRRVVSAEEQRHDFTDDSWAQIIKFLEADPQNVSQLILRHGISACLRTA